LNLDSEELVHQFQADWPGEAEASTLRLLARKLTDENDHLRAEIERLTSSQPATTYGTPLARPYVPSDPGTEEARHGS
jgi:hypothetical protein